MALPLLKIASAFWEDAISVNVVQVLAAGLTGVFRRVLTNQLVAQVDAIKRMPRIQRVELGSAIKMEQRVRLVAVGGALKKGQRIRLVVLGGAAKKGPQVGLVLRAFVIQPHARRYAGR